MIKKMMGFTLAEVLTTLMVIGVVAAMTIPTLMNSTNDQQLKVSYKKAMSVLSQGIQLMNAKEVECSVENTLQLAQCFAENVLSGSATTIDNGKTAAFPKNVIVTSDGMAYWFYYNSAHSVAPGSHKRSIEDICGKEWGLGASDYDGTNAACAVIVDLNGFSKGTKSFAGPDYDGQPDILNGTFEGRGEDQQAILITGTGVRPLYTSKVGSASRNKGYEWMYGESTILPYTH